MRRRALASAVGIAAATALWLVPLAAQDAAAVAATPPAVDSPSAKVWVGRYDEYERFLAEAEVVRTRPIGLGVTKPERAWFPDGSLAGSAAWKPIYPSRRTGFLESYKSEIAAYRLDRLLGLDMVPVAVERTLRGQVGAMILWVGPVRMWTDAKRSPPGGMAWARDIVRMRMFDNLAGNIDRNAGNMLIDPAGRLILIDHSRAFVTKGDLPTRLEHVDRELWTKFQALDEATIASALGEWLSTDQMRFLFRRRDRLAREIDRLVARRGEHAVFLR